MTTPTPSGLARKLAALRWEGTSDAERSEHATAMAAARHAKTVAKRRKVKLQRIAEAIARTTKRLDKQTERYNYFIGLANATDKRLRNLIRQRQEMEAL